MVNIKYYSYGKYNTVMVNIKVSPYMESSYLPSLTYKILLHLTYQTVITNFHFLLVL